MRTLWFIIGLCFGIACASWFGDFSHTLQKVQKQAVSKVAKLINW